MQSITSKKILEINLKDKTEQMPLVTYARWLCLIEAIELVCAKAKQMKIDTANNIDWIKPLAFQKYIEERIESMVDEAEIYENESNLEINKQEIKICNTQQEQVLQ